MQTTARRLLLLAMIAASVSFVSATLEGSPIVEFELATAGHHPQAVAAGPDGNLWMVESKLRKVFRVTQEGKITEFVIPDTTALLLQSITVGSDGQLWFTSPTDNTIRRVNTKGEFTGAFKIPTTTGKFGKNTSFPRGLAAGPDGNVWFAEMGGNKIGRITPNGEITEFPLPTPDSGPYVPAFDNSGRVWFAESTANKIARLDPATGKVDEFPLPSPNCLPRDMVTGADGNLWFSENQADKLGRMTPEGELKEFPLPAGSRPVGLVATADGVWYSSFGNGMIGRLTFDGKVQTFVCPTPRSSAGARHVHGARRQHLVRGPVQPHRPARRQGGGREVALHQVRSFGQCIWRDARE